MSGTTFVLTTGTAPTARSSRRAWATASPMSGSLADSTLAARTRFTVTLTGGTSGIRDTAGNSLTTVTWTFTTGR